MKPPQPWLSLLIGNSHLHWAQFEGDQQIASWDSPPLQGPSQVPQPPLPLYFASVVPTQSQLLRAGYSQQDQQTLIQEITLATMPLGNLYPSLGIDRALGLLAAGERWGYPVLVIDGGTAITLTGADGDRNLIGGAILPGIQLQLESLGLGTAALPQLDAATLAPAAKQPQRWALTTEGAIASGILHSLASSLADYVDDWQQQYPEGSIVTTGGSGAWIAAQLASRTQAKGAGPVLAHTGILAWRRQREAAT
ncbi:MAG: type III pantothenate kinase [Synechococcales cyanobacterium RM1_1_8]|nr:type III pantothenate kinase [Synechococcales cyanobacterium RM1_1_8]